VQAVEALRVARGWVSHIFRHSAESLFTPRKIPGTHFC
jgi:hypothetical protein